MILEIINTLLSLLPFVDTGKMKITTNLISLEFYNPIVGKNHWSEENYKYEPIQYRMRCSVAVDNKKKITDGINSCSLKIKCTNVLTDDVKIEGTFKSFENIPSNERRLTEIYQEGLIYFSDNLRNGFTLNFNYKVNGKKRKKYLIVKKI